MKDGISEVKEEMEESPDSGFKYMVSEGKAKYNESPENSKDRENTPQSPNDPNSPELDENDESGEDEGDGQSEQIPLLFVDVNLGEGTTGKHKSQLNLFYR